MAHLFLIPEWLVVLESPLRSNFYRIIVGKEANGHI